MRIRPHIDDYARAVSYVLLATWAFVFMFNPPVAFETGSDVVVRAVWLAFCILGCAFAVGGAVSGVDLKMELPGLMLAAIGPALYCVSQLQLILTGSLGRDALVWFALYATSTLFPRLLSLNAEVGRQRRIVRRAEAKK